MRTKQHNKMEAKLSRHKIAATLLMLLLTLAAHRTALGSVERPTVFRDLPQEENGPVAQPAPHPQQTLADGPQAPSTKISPLRSRFCQHQSQPLGLQSMRLEHAALSASSYSNAQVAPHLARLNLDLAGGGWCPGKPISAANFGKEWIQVRLNRSHVVTAIETQGRHQGGSGKEFAPHYQVEYSRNSGRTWHKWKDLRGPSVLRGNQDANTPVRNEFSPPIVGANVIRILPYSQHLRTVCLRFELYGCPYDEGAPVAYETQDGVVEPRWGHLVDYTYDGQRLKNGHLSGGLGQLVDGVRGPDNFSHNTGFEWVGWKSMNGDLQLEFTFRTVRNFTGALFHSNNLFSAGVEVFAAVDVHYGLDVALGSEPIRELLRSPALDEPSPAAETLWSPDVLSIEYEPDKRNENSRPVTVHLKQRLANKLRFVLKFASKWILVSEVEFLSQPVELLSPQNLLLDSDFSQAGQLVASLAPAKTYDEYVAILREHQLRKRANALLEAISAAAGSPEDTSAAAATTTTTTGGPLESSSSEASEWSPSVDPRKPSTNPMLQPPLFNYPPPPPPSPPLQPVGGDEPLAPEETAHRRHLGVATMIGLVLVGLLVLAGALFAVSSYRLRAQGPKLGQLPPHLAGADSNHKSGLHSFMSSVFSNGGGGGGHSDAMQQPPSDHLYNAIFATNERRHLEHHQRQTLKRLASLQKGQLLVSVKEPHSGSKTLFGRNQQNVNTQLIVGLNQTNPLAQQQIYNTNNCQSNQTYATNYSTSMSMASSSTGGGGGHHHGNQDYAGPDYAVPDVQSPILAAQYHLNHAFAPNHHLFGGNKMRPPTTTTNPLIPSVPARLEHNYELVQQQQPSHPTNHQRANSGGCPFASAPNNLVAATLRRPPPNPPVEECSPGSQSSSSNATATTSANSSSHLPADLYYYTPHPAERKQ